ncbi:MAG TPA: prepilin-type N-terminal cleavage/methylation domain-containing protein [Thermoanaerobaculia bacterium]|nr:prepilin-type N-terminal cleavage/methylation domain-containing protein [Thermoanaerobaculia bacterium]
MVALRGRRGESGFTLIELLVTLVIGLLLLTITLPAIQRFTHRATLEMIARQTTSLIQAARLEAVRSNVTVNVVFDFGAATDRGQVYAYADNNNNNTEDVGEREVGRLLLPQEVYFWGAPLNGGAVDGAAKGANVLSNFGTTTCTPGPCPNGGIAAFQPNGAAAKQYAVDFGDAYKNILQVKVANSAISKLELRKWDSTSGLFLLRDENGGAAWKWYP